MHNLRTVIHCIVHCTLHTDLRSLTVQFAHCASVHYRPENVSVHCPLNTSSYTAHYRHEKFNVQPKEIQSTNWTHCTTIHYRLQSIPFPLWPNANVGYKHSSLWPYLYKMHALHARRTVWKLKLLYLYLPLHASQCNSCETLHANLTWC